MNKIAGIENAARIIRNSKSCIAFTGAGISVESGIPPFRGHNSIWDKYDPLLLDYNYFTTYPGKSWPVIKEIFYDFFNAAAPNAAHRCLANLEDRSILKQTITQNIDNLHQLAGSRQVLELHGNSRQLKCLTCNHDFEVKDFDLSILPPRCIKCGGLIKPGFIFFGEQLPIGVYHQSIDAARRSDVCVIVGSTGEVMPAALIPIEAKRCGAVVIEVNPGVSGFTRETTDIHLKGTAAEVFTKLQDII